MSIPHQLHPRSREAAPPGGCLLTTGKGFNLRNSQGGEGECGAAGRAIWNLFEELGQSPATPPCAEAPGQPLALPAQLWPERGKSVGEQTGGAHGQGERHVLTGPLSFRGGCPGWHPRGWRAGWPDSWVTCCKVALQRSATSGLLEAWQGLARLGTPVLLSPAFLGPAPGADGSGNPWTAPFLLHSGSPACAHSQSALSLSTRPRPSPTPGRRPAPRQLAGGADAAMALG